MGARVGRRGEITLTIWRYIISGYRLEHNVLAKFIVGSSIECGLQCLNNGCCKSVNYKDTSGNEKNCELNDAIALERSEHLTKDEMYTYYEVLHPENVRTF